MLLASLLWVCPCPAQSEREKRYHFALDRGPRASVLEQFSRQTGLQVFTQFQISDSETQELGPLFGHGTADSALRELLRNTDLFHKWEDATTIRILLKIVRRPRAEDDVDVVVVTGTRLSGVEDGPAPVRVYGRQRIERYGVESLSGLTRSLPQQPFAFGAGHFTSGAQFVHMRGLGPDGTLVLLNGRRMPPSANSIAQNAVDLNNIPLPAVERIEVMSDAVSAIYGADAVGGVINIILKERIERPEIYLHYGQANGGGTQRRASGSIGTANDCLESALVLDYHDTAVLMGAQRELWRNQDFRRYGGEDYRNTASNPGNVYSLTGQPLPGLSSSRAAVPPGTTRPLTPADFIATDGAINLASSLADYSITPLSKRGSGYGSAKYSCLPGLSFFGEVLAEHSEVTSLRGPPSLRRQIVPATNPYNPFGTPVAVDYLFADMDPISYVYETQLLRGVGGARGTFNGWEWELTTVGHGEDGAATTEGEIDRLLLTGAINSSDPATALNLFTDASIGSSDLMASLMSQPRQLDFSFSTAQVSAFMRGPLFAVDGRPAELVIGGEWRRDLANFFESGMRVDAGRNIASMFSELRVPLLETLSLKLAARGDDYGAAGQTVNPQYGLSWRPTRNWLFRASYGTSFRPPSLFELYMPTLQSSLLIADPLRYDEVSDVRIKLGGNPQLEAVKARSFTTGFVFRPFDLPGTHFGVSYWRVTVHDRIMMPMYQELLKLDNPFADRVVRDPPGSQDLADGLPGDLRELDLTRVNYGALETGGIDLDASLQMERAWGCLKVELAATWIDEYLSRDMNPVLPLDRVGIANAQGTIPEWRLIGSIGWKLGPLGASTTTTFVPAYQDAHWWTGPIEQRIGSQTLVDLQTWVDFTGGGLLDGSRLTLGARNLFDRSARFAHAGGPSGYDVSQEDLVGRFLYVRVSSRF
jgi:iron complex outermembrane receptor protein